MGLNVSKQLFDAIAKNDKERMKQILEKNPSLIIQRINNDEGTPLMIACRLNQVTLVEILLSYKTIKINQQNKVISPPPPPPLPPPPPRIISSPLIDEIV